MFSKKSMIVIVRIKQIVRENTLFIIFTCNTIIYKGL